MPKVDGKRGVSAGQDGDEVSFERLDCTFSCVGVLWLCCGCVVLWCVVVVRCVVRGKTQIFDLHDSQKLDAKCLEGVITRS